MSTESPTRQANRLAQESSPYLLQHVHNPIDWYPWGDEALERARQLGRPIFLSIGYSACHWCHAMERETFSNESIAELLNENFVSIKVDREERPDLDDIYMAAAATLSGQGGWPLNVFLTPDLKPFFAGTYFPAEDSPQGPGFASLVEQLAAAWKSNRADLENQAEKVRGRMERQFKGPGRVLGLEPELLDEGISELARRFDPENGGFSGSPKFPAPSSLHLLLRYYTRSQDPRVLEMATLTLDKMAQGGLYDHLGGGFFRYAVDASWTVPHFEKMLYDNAQLAVCYLEAYQVTQNPLYRRVARATLDFVLGQLRLAEGGFACSLDADCEGAEGKYYAWTIEEVASHLGESGARNFGAFYAMQPAGNWQGTNLLHTPRPIQQVAAQLGVEAEGLEQELEQSRRSLLEVRAQRFAPGRDEKVLASWNGMMIQALAEGYRILGEASYLEAARQAADFVLAQMVAADGSLWHCWKDNQATVPGFLDDYAWLGEGLLSLYEACGQEIYFEKACALAERALEDFAEAGGGFFETSARHSHVLLRHRSQQDGSVPGSQAIMAMLLARLSFHLERPEYRSRALDVLASMGKLLRQSPSSFSRHLVVLDFVLAGPLEVVACLPAEAPRHPLMEALALHFLPNRSISWKFFGVQAGHPKASQRTDEEAALHFCQSSACAAPVQQPEDIIKALTTLRHHARFELHPRVMGKATAQSTARLAEAQPSGYSPLGKTGWQVSRYGFGGYRVDDETLEHEEALQQALEGGINVLDTSANYTDGGSERLMGALLRRLSSRREELVVVSKAGYVQGSNLDLAMARVQIGRPYSDMVEYEEGCWHCIHPEYLSDQLERSLMRLSLETLDVLLLHNPEYFLMHCQRQARNNLAEVREEFEGRLERAFVFLEEAVAQGRIQCYGISSNTFAGPEDSLTTVRLSRCLEIAHKVAGENHHFRVVQVPLNVLEPSASQGFLSQAQEAGLGVLVNRPLNAFVQQTLVRLADFECESEELEWEAHLQALAQVEAEYRERFGPFVQGQGADQLFRFAENLQPLPMHLQHLEHWTQLESQRIRPALMEQVAALDQAMNGPIAEAWIQWREKYMAAFRDVSNDLEEVALRKSQSLSDSVSALLRPALPEAPSEARLDQLALWVVAHLPGVNCVLVGMRRPDYVDSVLPVLGWPACPQAQAAIKVLEGWSNPQGVLA